MRVVIAMMKHETNTFSPVPTPWARFEEWGAHFGEQAMLAYEDTAMPMGSYIRLARDAGMDIVTPVAAEAMPSGIVQADAYERISGAICDAVAAGCDAVMLDLHGAMVSETTPDGEGALLERIRSIAPAVPICVTCDLHANLTEAMVANCTALIGYKTYPHIDMAEVGEQVGKILLRAIEGEVDPVMAWGNRPLLAQTLRMGHEDEPMGGLLEMARQAESGGLLAMTVFGGFPLADVEQAGLSAIAISDGNHPAARSAVEDILAAAWSARAEFVHRHRPLTETVALAKTLTEHPVILLDHADNVGSGGTEDVMTVIAEVMRQQLDDVAVAAVWDPEAARIMREAGLGAEVTLQLGGRTDMPSIGLRGQPFSVTGRVARLTDGRFKVEGPMYTGVTVNMGPTALLDTGQMQIVVVSQHHEPWDLGVFTSLGIDPANKKYLLLKSRIHYRAGFGGLARHTLHCDGAGVTTSDNDQLNFRNVRRPIFPLDGM